MTRSTYRRCLSSSASSLRSGGEERDRFAREPRLDDGALHDLGEDAVGVQGGAAAAQDDGVARLEAQGGRVDGHVGTRLVDHGDDAERDADLAQLDAVVEAPAVDDLADGVGQGGDVLHGGLDVAQPVFVQQEPVDKGVGETVLARQAHVLVVLREDLGGAPPEGIGDGEERVVLTGARKAGEHTGRPVRLGAHLLDAHPASSSTSTRRSRCTTSSSSCGFDVRSSRCAGP